MFYDLIIIGRLVSQSSEWNVLSLLAAPPCVKDKLADIVKRTIQTEPAEAAQFSVCSQELGWHSHAVLLSQSRWVGACVCACMHVSCVCFHKKPRGHGTDCAGGDLHQPCACQRKLTAELALASIFLIFDQAREALHPALFFTQRKLSPHIQRSRHKPSKTNRFYTVISTHQKNCSHPSEAP